MIFSGKTHDMTRLTRVPYSKQHFLRGKATKAALAAARAQFSQRKKIYNISTHKV